MVAAAAAAIGIHASVSRMFGTGAIDLEPVVDAPLVVDAETGEPGDGLALVHLVQTDHTFAFLLLQHILIITDSGFR